VNMISSESVKVQKHTLHFLTDHQLGYLPNTKRPIAAGASARLRVIFPAEQLSKLGWATNILGLGTATQNEVIAALDGSEYVVVSKIFRPSSVALVKLLSKRGIKIIADFCDNHLEGGEFYEAHHTILSSAERCIANTPAMHRLLRTHGFHGPIHVIEDMIEHPRLEPRKPPSEGQINLIAFGNKFVCLHLEQWFPALKSFARNVRPLTLEIVTLIDASIIQWENAFRNLVGDSFRFSVSHWNEIGMEQAFRRADIAIIPSEISDFNKTKSANRLLEATYAGLPVVAYPIEPYLPYRDVVLVTKDIHEGLETILVNPNQSKLRVGYAQQLAGIRHDSIQIGLEWHRMFEELEQKSDLGMNISFVRMELHRIDSHKVDKVLAYTELGDENHVNVVHDARSESRHCLAISAFRSILGFFDKFGIPDWVESFYANSKRLPGSKSLDDSDISWKLNKIVALDTTIGTHLFRCGYFKMAINVMDKLIQSQKITEYEAHEFLYGKYRIEGIWETCMPGIVWKTWATRLLDTFNILESVPTHGFDEPDGFPSTMLEELGSYWLLKHLNNHNLIRQVRFNSSN
jgi:glycosyltransferase involved in cell wall biosynthesis